LADDIKAHGLTSPIVLWRADPDAQAQLLDGRNRLDAMELVGLQTVGDDGRLKVPFTPQAPPTDPYAYVISANIHRRHLTAEKKRELIAELIKAQPTKSNRQIAKTTGVSHPHVAKVRQEMEAAGDVETVTTSVDNKGRQQPAHKSPAPARREQHVCWQCGVRAAVGEVQQHAYDAFWETDVWLHPACVADFERKLKEEAAARDDIGEASTGEIERLNARVEELQNEKRVLELRVIGLESENNELKTRLADLTGDVPPFLDRTRRPAPGGVKVEAPR
jgi:hypothetical protein